MDTQEKKRCWIVVDMTHGFATDDLRELSQHIYREVIDEPVYALVQDLHARPTRAFRGWGEAELLGPIAELRPPPATTVDDHFLTEISAFDEVAVIGSDIQSGVSLLAASLSSKGLPVVVPASLCVFAGDDQRHAALEFLAYQLGEEQVR